MGGAFSSLAPGVDGNWLLNSLVVVIIGGMGSLGGAAVGAILLRVRLHVLGGLPADFEPRLLHRILANLHVRTADRGARPAPARPVREARVSAPRSQPRAGRPRRVELRHWWNSKTPAQLFEYGVVAAALVVVTLGYRSMGVYFAHDLMTNVFWYGIAAASLIFLSAYGGMVSLGPGLDVTASRPSCSATWSRTARRRGSTSATTRGSGSCSAIVDHDRHRPSRSARSRAGAPASTS